MVMVYLKSILAGVLVVVATGVGVVGLFAVLAKILGGDVRPGANLTWQTGVTAALIFVLGFLWQFRRMGKTPQESKADKKTSGSASTRRG